MQFHREPPPVSSPLKRRRKSGGSKKQKESIRIRIARDEHRGGVLNLRSAQHRKRAVIPQTTLNIPVDSHPLVENLFIRTKQRTNGLSVYLNQKIIHSIAIRRTAVFAVVALAMVIPLRALIAYQSLANSQGQVLGAVAEEKELKNQKAVSELPKMGKVINNLNPRLKNLLLLTPRGREGLALLEINEAMSAVLANLENIRFLNETPSAVERLRIVREAVGRTTQEINAARQAMLFVRGVLIPEEYKNLFVEAQDRLPRLYRQLKRLEKFLAVSDVLVGADRPRRYLLAFQNNHELRATGGFIGSFSVIEFDKGNFRLINMPAYGSYSLDRNLRVREAPPNPLRTVIDKMTFHDANWDPHFPSSARELLKWYEKSDGETLDGVAAINGSLVQQLLAAVGPIDVSELGFEITTENFTAAAESFAASRRGTTEPPKELLSVLAPKLLDRLNSASSDFQQSAAVLSVLARGLAERDIQLYHEDPKVQQTFLALGYAGAFLETAPGQDYFFPVFTNIGGWKTDQVMETEIELNTNLLVDGTVEHILIAERKHNGLPEGPEGTVQENKSYIRIYVPEGSALDDFQGFDSPPQRTGETAGVQVFKEHGRTVFAGWLITPRGESKKIQMRWKTPQLLSSNADSYSLVVQKQAGLENVVFREQHNSDNFKGATEITPNGLEKNNSWLDFTGDLMLQISR